MWDKIKEWSWIILVAAAGIIAALFLNQKPRWIKEKEREIKDRDKEIDRSKTDSEQLQKDYKEAKVNHDKEIEEAGKQESNPSFTDPDSAASFIDDILGKRK